MGFMGNLSPLLTPPFAADDDRDPYDRAALPDCGPYPEEAVEHPEQFASRWTLWTLR